MQTSLKAIVFASVLCSLLAISALADVTAAQPPNVIVVNLDDIGPAWFPPYAREIQPQDVEEKICKEYAKLHEAEGSFDLNKHPGSCPPLDAFPRQPGAQERPGIRSLLFNRLTLLALALRSSHRLLPGTLGRFYPG